MTISVGVVMLSFITVGCAMRAAYFSGVSVWVGAWLALTVLSTIGFAMGLAHS